MKSPLWERIQWETQLNILKNYTEREIGIILYEKIQNSKCNTKYQKIHWSVHQGALLKLLHIYVWLTQAHMSDIRFTKHPECT